MTDNFVPYLNEGGLRPDLPDHRDYGYEAVFAAGEAPEIDWEAGFDCFGDLDIDPIKQDQGMSSSCTAQATKSHVRKHLAKARILDGEKEISATPIYNHIKLPGGGAYLRDAIAFPSEFGSLREEQVSSYENGLPPQESYFDSFVFTDSLKSTAKKLDLFSYRKIDGATSSIDIFAHAIIHNQGGIGGYVGTNEGWTQPVCQPPQAGEKRWGHAVSHDAHGEMDVAGYGIPVGTKCIFTKNSWGDRFAIRNGRWKGYQAIPENYFSSGEQTAAGFAPGIYVFNAWVLVPDENINPVKRAMEFLNKNNLKLIQDSEQSGSFGLIKDGKLLRATPERMAELVATYLVKKEGVPVPAELWNDIEVAGLIKEF